MKTIIPPKLKKGDKIMIIAPACSATTVPALARKKAEKHLKDMGFISSYSKHAFEQTMLTSSSIDSRIKDLHLAFKDKSVKGIICVRGGFNSNTLLPHINWKLLKSNPKPLIGYSDITALSNALYAKTGLVSYSGPVLLTLGNKDQQSVKYTKEYLQKCVMSSESFGITPSAERSDLQTSIKPFIFQAGSAEGIVVGGNLCTLNLLQGTEYMPEIKNSILFIEEDDFNGEHTDISFDRDLESLLQLPGASSIQAILVGRFPKGAEMSLEKIKFIFKSKNISPKIPVVFNLDFGHTTPMFTFPIGGTIRVDASGKTVKIKILKH